MRKVLLLFLPFFSFTLIPAETAGELTISVENIDPPAGQLMIALCNSRENYNQEVAPYIGRVLGVSGSKMEVTIPGIPEGEYAVKIIHDENSNGKLDTNFLGIPREGFGFSNNAKPGMGPPAFEKSKFYVKETCLISIKLTRF